jgi:hypothetical protein
VSEEKVRVMLALRRVGAHSVVAQFIASGPQANKTGIMYCLFTAFFGDTAQ